MKRFLIYNVVEYRSDDPTWIMWRVKHTNGKDYLLAYSNGKLKEVYFVGEGIPNYFMSCRADDLEQISHYYVDRNKKEVRRYEKGNCNRIYKDYENGIMECNTHKYTQKAITDETLNFEQLYNDLTQFLEAFSKTGKVIKKPLYVT